ncbi:MAG: hypothetical protein RLZZ458_2891, partial [Planctomycetota bacterium]
FNGCASANTTQNRPSRNSIDHPQNTISPNSRCNRAILKNRTNRYQRNSTIGNSCRFTHHPTAPNHPQTALNSRNINDTSPEHLTVQPTLHLLPQFSHQLQTLPLQSPLALVFLPAFQQPTAPQPTHSLTKQHSLQFRHAPCNPVPAERSVYVHPSAWPMQTHTSIDLFTTSPPARLPVITTTPVHLIPRTSRCTS